MPSGITSPAVNMTVGWDVGDGPSVPAEDLAIRVRPDAIYGRESTRFGPIETGNLPPGQALLVRDAIRETQNELAASESWQREFLGRFYQTEGAIMGAAAGVGSAEERSAARVAAAGLTTDYLRMRLREESIMGQVMPQKPAVTKYPEPDSAIAGPEKHPVDQDPTFTVFDEIELL